VVLEELGKLKKQGSLRPDWLAVLLGSMGAELRPEIT
jgi:hypothetical protein